MPKPENEPEKLGDFNTFAEALCFYSDTNHKHAQKP